jgi:hypothetical protein
MERLRSWYDRQSPPLHLVKLLGVAATTLGLFVYCSMSCLALQDPL